MAYISQNLKPIFWLTTILISLIFLNTLLLDVHSGSSGIVLNEIMYDPVGTDLGYEWIEVYNSSNTEISIEGWEIQVAGTIFKSAADLSGSVQPDQYFLICEAQVENCDLYVPKLAMQNGGGATDGVQLLDANGVVVDTVVYDSPNSNNLTNESGVVIPDSETAPKGASGTSLGRKGFMDSDNSFDDFKLFDIPTPGSINILIQEDEDEEELAQTGSSPLVGIVISLLLLYPYIHISKTKFKRRYNGNKESE